MRTTHFRDLLVHLVPYQVDENTWSPKAVIEDPKNGEVASVTLHVTVQSEEHANIKALLEAHARIQADTWRMISAKKSALNR
ncbi:hypothetical protein [Rhodoferax sp.]|uniref:hypothetical protein n=1 Tax=Rhodoferax sp. TaxID=50421 RepID=UPI00374D3A49